MLHSPVFYLYYYLQHAVILSTLDFWWFYKELNGLGLQLSSEPSRRLRSSGGSGPLSAPRVKTKCGEAAFSSRLLLSRLVFFKHFLFQLISLMFLDVVHMFLMYFIVS